MYAYIQGEKKVKILQSVPLAVTTDAISITNFYPSILVYQMPV